MSEAGVPNPMYLDAESDAFRVKYCAKRFLLIDELMVVREYRGSGYGRGTSKHLFLSKHILAFIVRKSLMGSRTGRGHNVNIRYGRYECPRCPWLYPGGDRWRD
jgi:hypothetical protein